MGREQGFGWVGKERDEEGKGIGGETNDEAKGSKKYAQVVSPSLCESDAHAPGALTVQNKVTICSYRRFDAHQQNSRTPRYGRV